MWLVQSRGTTSSSLVVSNSVMKRVRSGLCYTRYATLWGRSDRFWCVGAELTANWKKSIARSRSSCHPQKISNMSILLRFPGDRRYICDSYIVTIRQVIEKTILVSYERSSYKDNEVLCGALRSRFIYQSNSSINCSWWALAKDIAKQT